MLLVQKKKTAIVLIRIKSLGKIAVAIAATITKAESQVVIKDAKM